MNLYTRLAVVLAVSAFVSSSFAETKPIVPAIPQSIPVGTGQSNIAKTTLTAQADQSQTIKNDSQPLILTGSEQTKAYKRKIRSKKKEPRDEVLDGLKSEIKYLKDKRFVDTIVKESTQRPVNAASVQSKTVYSYTPDGIYTVYGAEDRVIDIQLQPGEKLTNPPIAGDTVRWVVGIATSHTNGEPVTHVLLKPMQAGIETNFIIVTDRHAYHLYAKSGTKFFIPTLAWNYPQEEMSKSEAYKKEEQRLDDMVVGPALSADKLNFKYKISPGDDYSWTPVRVFDDGSKTYIQMSANMKNSEAPAFFIKDGNDLNLVNYRVRGDFYIIDRLFVEGEFRCGKKDVVEIKKEKPWSLFSSN